MARILIGSRNLVFGPLLADKLKNRGHRAQWYGADATLLAMARLRRPDLVVLDFRDAPRETWDLNGELSRQDPTMPVLFLSSAGGETFAQVSGRIAAAAAVHDEPALGSPYPEAPVSPNHSVDLGVCDGSPS